MFLTGDMHCCYHATMRIGHGLKRTIGHGSRARRRSGEPAAARAPGRFRSAECQAHHPEPRAHRPRHRLRSDTPAVSRRSQRCDARQGRVQTTPASVPKTRSDVVPEVEWNVIRTLTDPGPEGWRPVRSGERSLDLPASGPPIGESVMAGRISFVEQRLRQDLQEWQR